MCSWPPGDDVDVARLIASVLADVLLAVGCAEGCVRLFDVRMMSAFVTLQDPVAGNIQQVNNGSRIGGYQRYVH